VIEYVISAWRFRITTEFMHGALRFFSACAVAACATGSHPDLPPQSAPVVRLIRSGPGISLEVLDWGGRGPALVFLAGLGNTAHVFDDFAPQFTDSFHVVGITRRGFGASATAPPPRELDTLVADITAVLDTLGLDQVRLIGHSIAGEEMTRFAELHAPRCTGLIYLDAAYDRSGVDTLASRQPAAPGPRIRALDTASLASWRALYRRVMGTDQPESEISATARFDAATRYLGRVTDDSLTARVLSGRGAARYDRVACRALAIYAMPDSVADVIPYYTELDAAGRAQAVALLRFVQGVVVDSRDRFAGFSQHTVVELHGGNHFIFLQHPGEVARAMHAFLSASSPPQQRKVQ
jgi:non-heme chloroperoxidase